MTNREWPHPDTPLPLTRAADILGVDRTTLERNIRDLRGGAPARTRRDDVAAVSAIYAGLPEGTAAKPPAGTVMSALGIDPSTFEPAPVLGKRAPRLRIGKKEIAVWRRLSPQRLAEEIRDAWLRMESRETRNAKRRVLEIAEIMRERQVPMPEKWITPESVMVFASMADWAGRAPIHSVWPFMLGRSGRPVDLVIATTVEMRVGCFAFLTPVEYAERLVAALLAEAAASEGVALASSSMDGQPPQRGRRMAAGKDRGS